MKKMFSRFLQSWLRYCCAAYIRRTKPFVIGITGSVGKSTCRTIVAQVITQMLPDLRVYTSPKNFNGELGLLLSVMKIESFSPSFLSFFHLFLKSFFLFYKDLGVDVYVLEYGIDRPGEMGELLNAVVPHVAIVTVVDTVHLMNFTSIDHIASEKSLLVKAAKELVMLNVDDERVAAMRDLTSVDIFRYSFTGGDRCGLWVDKFSVSMKYGIHSTFTAHIGKEQRLVNCDRWNHYDAVYVTMGLAVVDVLALQYQVLVFSPDNLTFTMLPGRASLLHGLRDSLIFDSSYNASPESMSVMLQEALHLHKTYFSHYSLCLLLGEMRELGSSSYIEHSSLVEHLLCLNFEKLLVVGGEWLPFASQLSALPGFSGIFSSSRKAGVLIKHFIESSDVPYFIFVKGSQNTVYLEEAVKIFIQNSDDASSLARQEKWWLKKKELYYESINDL